MIQELLALHGIANSVIPLLALFFCHVHARLRAGKHQIYEHTLRVPFAIAGPGLGPAGSSISSVMSMVDVAPTIVELAGAIAAVATPMDGRSNAPTLVRNQSATQNAMMLVEFWSLAEKQSPCGTASIWSDSALPSSYSNSGAADSSISRPSGCFNPNISHSDCSNNTFIGIRIVNATHDLAYAEYTELADWHFENVYFREL